GSIVSKPTLSCLGPQLRQAHPVKVEDPGPLLDPTGLFRSDSLLIVWLQKKVEVYCTGSSLDLCISLIPMLFTYPHLHHQSAGRPKLLDLCPLIQCPPPSTDLLSRVNCVSHAYLPNYIRYYKSEYPDPSRVVITQTTTVEPTRSPKPKISENQTETIEPKTDAPEISEQSEVAEAKPSPRLLTLNVDELQNFANVLHNQTDKKKDLTDLSDVNLDDDEEEPQRIGEKLVRGCDEICECSSGGIFECSPRCKHPYIRRGRRLNDPLCFESPVDACCSIIACATGTGDRRLSDPLCFESPVDACCSIIACATGTGEPIGSVKVLQNNTVQVNLIHLNDTEDPIHLLLSNDGGKTFKDVELKHTNQIMNLEGGKEYILKTKETGTKFNFTITTSDKIANEVSPEDGNESKVGCWEDGKFYGVGEEFQIGCSELCECTGAETRECASLVCPNHVGLELMSKGCVRWAPSPPAQPPNCCPRSARCLSDGTCHYNGVPVPNWTEVPISLTGCEQRCFCENGELDCQEVCSSLPPVPPQSMRCPPMHRPAHVNISDEDCCKQWGCVPSGNDGSSYKPYRMKTLGESIMFVTPLPTISTDNTQGIPTSPDGTNSINFYEHHSPVKSFRKVLENANPVPVISIPKHETNYNPGDNITVFTLDDINAPFKTIHAETPIMSHNQWTLQNPNPKPQNLDNEPQPHFSVSHVSHTHPEKHTNFAFADTKVQDMFHQPSHDSMRKVAMSSLDNFNYFIPSHENTVPAVAYPYYSATQPKSISEPMKISLFQPTVNNRTDYLLRTASYPTNKKNIQGQPSHGKHITVLRSKDLKPVTHDEDILRSQDWNTHVLSKQPNPYESVMLRPIPSPKKNVPRTHSQKLIYPQVPKMPSTLNLERFLSQLEVESEVNKNLGRSADKNRENAIGHAQPDFPQKPQPPSFLPTVPPEAAFPEEEIPSYDQNNIHRPINGPDSGIPGLPPGLHLPPSFGDMNKKLSVISVESDSPTSITMLLGLPSVLVGLRGSILTTPRLEFRLSGLKPSTTYKIRGKLFLHNLPVAPASEIYSVRTQDMPLLAVVEVNDTSARVSWRHFTEDELQFIDGVQVSMTELLHHSRSAAELHELRPGSRYEASLVLVPPPGATTELNDPGKILTTGQ
ncbi:putative epidermal cell surface receptor, partial [Operophtera brumata]